MKLTSSPYSKLRRKAGSSFPKFEGPKAKPGVKEERVKTANIRERPAACLGCPLHPSSEKFDPLKSGAYVPPSEPINCDALLVGIAPAEEEEIRGEPLTGPSGRQVVRAIEWGLTESFNGHRTRKRKLKLGKMNLVQCRTTKIGAGGHPINRDPTAAEIKECSRRYLWPLVLKTRAKVIAPLGKLAYDTLTLVGPKRKNAKGQAIAVSGQDNLLDLMGATGKVPGGLAGTFRVGLGHRLQVERPIYEAVLTKLTPKRRTSKK